MPRYLSLISFTDQGVRSINESLTRAEDFKTSVTDAGGRVELLYWAVGSADRAVIFDAPDEATGAKFLLKLAHDGFVRTNTLRVYDSEEFKSIVSSL
ncbi:MAG: GYD domain-containing protein [Planctomycetaceae bacterium]|nr:GYD domain-containing protein [Planctomycetales bacterium]MCB9921623.1 GYD domain-containing protein [Planctomycetaceae bacterium]